MSGCECTCAEFSKIGFLMTKPADGRKRVVIEGVDPEIDAGRFPIKRIIGDAVQVEADVFGDGHDHVICYLQFRHEDDSLRPANHCSRGCTLNVTEEYLRLV